MPTNAEGYFIGDPFGGCGYEIKLPDGTIQRNYVSFPTDSAILRSLLTDHTLTHKGQPIEDMSIENCCTLYYNALKDIVDRAIQQFLKN
jgi:hypothetical protein